MKWVSFILLTVRVVSRIAYEKLGLHFDRLMYHDSSGFAA